MSECDACGGLGTDSHNRVCEFCGGDGETSPTYRPGDIAMVKSMARDEVAVWTAAADIPRRTDGWVHLDGTRPIRVSEVGPVLGNVADIAAMMTKAHEAFDDPIDLDDPYTVAYVKGRNHRLDEITRLKKAASTARREALAEAEESLGGCICDERPHASWCHLPTSFPQEAP